MKRLFTEHPASVEETYLEHMGMALGFSRSLIWAAFVTLVHAFLPFLFESTGSNKINELHHRMVTHRHASSSSTPSKVHPYHPVLEVTDGHPGDT